MHMKMYLVITLWKPRVLQKVKVAKTGEEISKAQASSSWFGLEILWRFEGSRQTAWNVTGTPQETTWRPMGPNGSRRRCHTPPHPSKEERKCLHHWRRTSVPKRLSPWNSGENAHLTWKHLASTTQKICAHPKCKYCGPSTFHLIPNGKWSNIKTEKKIRKESTEKHKITG